MGAIIKLLQSIRNLTKAGSIKSIEQAYRLAKRELGDRFNTVKKQIDDAFNQGKKEQILDKRTKDIKKTEESGIKSLETDIAEGSIMNRIEKSAKKLEEASNKMKRIQKEQEATEKLKEDPKLQEILRSMGVEDTPPLDSTESVRAALKNMEDRMRVGNNESNIRATLREFLERRLKDGTLNIPDAAERDAIEKVYQGGVDPIEVFRKAYGEDALIAVDDVFDQYGDKIMRESNNYKEIGDKFEKLFKFNRGFYDMAELPVPKKDYGFDPGLMSNKEFADKLRKDLKEKEMLKDFDPTGRKPNAKGGLTRTSYAMGKGPVLPEDPTKPVNPFGPKPTGPVLPDKSMMASDDANERLLEQLFEEFLDLGFSPEIAAEKAREEFYKRDYDAKAKQAPSIKLASAYDYNSFDHKINELKAAYKRYKKGSTTGGRKGTMTFEQFAPKFAAENFSTGGRVRAASGGLADLLKL